MCLKHVKKVYIFEKIRAKAKESTNDIKISIKKKIKKYEFSVYNM